MKDAYYRSVSIVVVTFGVKGYLRDCLESIRSQAYPGPEVFVVDNSSPAELVAGVVKDFPWVRLIANHGNLFYGASLNKAIELSKSEYVLCLNDDTVLDKDFVRKAIKGFLIDGRIGMVSGRVMRPDRRTIDSCGLFLTACRTARERGYGEPDRGQFEREGYIFGVSGACAFYKRKMLDEIKERTGYFDSRFRMFYEDLDIAWRANRRGWKAYYIPGARAYHVRGASFRPDSGLNKPLARRYLPDGLHCELIRNRYLTLLKNDSFWGLVLHFFPIFIYDISSLVYVLFFRPQVLKLFFTNKNASQMQSGKT